MYTIIAMCGIIVLLLIRQVFKIKIPILFLGLIFFTALTVDLVKWEIVSSKENARIEVKRRQNVRQDSVLITMLERVEELMLENDTAEIKRIIPKIRHLSDDESPYKKDTYFSEEYYSYKEYWDMKREELKEIMISKKDDSFMSKLFD